MNFFKSVFADEQTPPDSPTSPDPQSNHSAWTFGSLLNSLAAKSDSVIETYRRDLHELSSGLKRETSVIRDVASRSFESGASVAQHSLESVGQAIDDIGNIVLKSTAQIISHGTGNENNNNDRDRTESNYNIRVDLDSDLRRYSRFEQQVRLLQRELNTYCNVPDDEVEFDKWKIEGFVLDEKREEIDRIFSDNGVVRVIYDQVVPNQVDEYGFWSRYFYRIYKLKQVEEAREKLVKRAIAGEDEEDLSWDFDEEEGEASGNVQNIEPEANRAASNVGVERKEEKDGVGAVEGKGESGGDSCKDSDVSIVSSQSVPEVEELGWDQIEDVGSEEEAKQDVSGSKNASRANIRKRLNSAEAEEDLSWDIEDEDDSCKP